MVLLQESSASASGENQKIAAGTQTLTEYSIGLAPPSKGIGVQRGVSLKGIGVNARSGASDNKVLGCSGAALTQAELGGVSADNIKG
jgi:hypothetical protein